MILAEDVEYLEHAPARAVVVQPAVETPGVEFVRPCNLCPHMKRITLPKILDSLVYLREEITIGPDVAARARAAVERMVELGK